MTETKTKIDLGIVQETLLIPLWARAVELNQSDPILTDPKSYQILQGIDYDFDKFAAAKDSQVGCCLRGLLLDDWVRRYLAEYPQGTVVEIGAGLNTRFERVDNGTVRWFDLDLPDVMELRQQFFTECDRRKFIVASALDREWCDLVKGENSEQPCLFVAEGVLMYLPEEQVREFFVHLLEHFPGSLLIFDSMSPLMVKTQKRHDSLKHTSAQFLWGISNIRRIETWNPNYKVTDIKTFCDIPPRYLRRFPLLNRLIFRFPPLRDTYRLTLVRFG